MPPANTELIKALRQVKGIKQDVVAKKLGIKQQAYSKIERCSKLSEEKFQKILSALNCTADDVAKIKNFLPQQ